MSSDRVAVVGVGLIGGSLGMGLRARGIRVVGIGRSPERLALAQRLGALDSWSTDFAAARGCGLVFLCTTVGVMERMMEGLAPYLEEEAVVTDVGSVKRSVLAAAGRSLPEHVRFVGGHPIAGSHRTGVEAARADLFQGAVCVLTPTERSRGAEDRVEALWASLGARVVRMSAAEHDAALAVTSHSPHLVAAALANAFGKAAERSAALRELTAGGFRDTTRIAASSPRMWVDIFLQNADEVLRACADVRAELEELAGALQAGDGERLLALLEAARSARSSLDEQG